MDRPAMGVRWGSEACAATQPAAGRREQAVPSALVWAAGAGRAEIEEARRPLNGLPTVTACASNFFLGNPQICGKQHTGHLPLFQIIYSPFANSYGFFGAHILFVSITAHIVATVKKLYETLHISVQAELFLIPKFRLTFKLILKINVYQYKIQQILHA